MINRSPSFSRWDYFNTRLFVNRDGNLKPKNIYDTVLLSCNSPKVTWVPYNHPPSDNNSWSIQPKYSGTIFSSSFPVYNFFKLHKKEDSNNLPQGTSLGYYPASWKGRKKTQKQYWQLCRPVAEKDDNFLLNIKTYVALLKIWWQRLVLMANDDCLQKKRRMLAKKVEGGL